MTKIATFNINSIRSRLPNLLEWLGQAQPDVVCLQEIKCVDEQFPALELEEMGYNLAVYGQKSYNGVAILSKFPFEEVKRGLPGDDSDEQARYIEAVLAAPGQPIRVASIYLPNGGSVDSEKFPYKLKFLERLAAHSKTLLDFNEITVLAGDYNVAPKPADVFDPVRLAGTTCFHPLEHERLRMMTHAGYYDAYRLLHPHTREVFSFWDYRGGSFQNNAGYRIDHLMLSPQAADKLVACDIHTSVRAQEKASDHAPVMVELRL